MPIVYFDNYKGFNSTFINLKNVNFLVGENSTGKTSVLKLIRLLSENKFWYNLDFSNDEVDLGYFSEIASEKKTKKYFEVGILADTIVEKKVRAFKIRYCEKDGLPSLKELCFIDGDLNIELFIDGEE